MTNIDTARTQYPFSSKGCRVERDAPWGTPARSSTTLKTDFAVFRRLPLIAPYVQFSRIRLSVWDWFHQFHSPSPLGSVSH